MSSKNFAVSFINKDENTNTVLASVFKRDIMDIMIKMTNYNSDYTIAENNKIAIICDYLNNNPQNVEYLIYMYGFENALKKYKERFGDINSNIEVLMKDLAIIIIDEIILIYEIQDRESHSPPHSPRHSPEQSRAPSPTPSLLNFLEDFHRRGTTPPPDFQEYSGTESEHQRDSIQVYNREEHRNNCDDLPNHFNADERSKYNLIAGAMISENTNY
jgi:hypothetical protein